MRGIDIAFDVHPVTRWKRHRDDSRDFPVDESWLRGRKLRRHITRVGRLRRNHVEYRLTLRVARYRSMRLVHEVLHSRAEPVVASSGAVVFAHSLLNDGPLSVSRQKEAVVIDPESILNRGRVDLRSHPAVVGETRAVYTELLSESLELGRSFPGCLALSAGDEDAELVAAAREAFLERAADGGGNAA